MYSNRSDLSSDLLSLIWANVGPLYTSERSHNARIYPGCKSDFNKTKRTKSNLINTASHPHCYVGRNYNCNEAMALTHGNKDWSRPAAEDASRQKQRHSYLQRSYNLTVIWQNHSLSLQKLLPKTGNDTSGNLLSSKHKSSAQAAPITKSLNRC